MSNTVLMIFLFIFNLYFIIAIKEEVFSYFDEGKLCEFNITSEKNGRTGQLQSPGYPKQYDPNVRCEYHFISKGPERVQLVFSDFDLYHPDNDNQDTQPVCRGEYDHLTAYVELNNRMSEIETFCGTYIPPQLMSSRNQLTLEFIAQTALNPYSRVYRGFNLTYKFVTDFAIHTGVPDPHHVCGFIYNSSRANNGSIQSPNHPGFYPRETDCHYTFHGKQDEKVRIFFTYFDVEGEPPYELFVTTAINDVTQAMTLNSDLKMSRYCGYSGPPENGMESERDFFNVTFHSNSVFDRTGFFAYYQFISQDSKAALKKVKSPSSAWSNKQKSMMNLLIPSLILYRLLSS